MNLNFFKQLNQESDKLKDTRVLSSDQYYAKGLALLELAEAKGFTQSESLLEACELFLKALKTNREDVRPYFALAYVFLILGDLDQALIYLYDILKKEASHPLALQMKEHILKTIKQNKTPNSQASKNPLGQDSDDLFELTQKDIQNLTRRILGNPFPSLANTPYDLDVLTKTLAVHSEQKAKLNQHIGQLEAEIEVSELREKLKPAEIYADRLTHLIQYSNKALALQDKINQEWQSVKNVIQESKDTTDPDDISILEENLEILFENQTQYQNSIHDLADQKLSTTLLQKALQKLMHFTQELEYEIDSVSERLLS